MKLRTALLGTAILALTACASAKTIQNPSQKRSSDPMLRSIMAAFQAGCIENAPTMDNERIRASFKANEPILAGSMIFIASGTKSSCSVRVNNYGSNRPAPSYGDINHLVRVLHARVGGEVRYKTSEKGALVRVPGRKFSIGGAIQHDGGLSFVLFH